MPNNETEGIEAIIAEIIIKVRKSKPAKKPDAALSIEAKVLRKRIIAHLLTLQDSTQADQYLYLLLKKLIDSCDQLFMVYNTVSPDTQILLHLAGFVRNLSVKKINPKTELPLAFIHQQQPLLKERWEKLKNILQLHQMPEKLVDITALPVELFHFAYKKLTWGDYTWIRRYFNLLENMDWEDPGCDSGMEALISQLLRMDFNHQRFFNHCYKLVKEKVAAKTGKKHKLQELLICRTLILQDKPIASHRFEPKAESICVQLCDWIDAEILRVAGVETDNPAEGFCNPYKLLHSMNVICIAIWYNMLYKLGFFREQSLEVLAEKLSHNCSTKRKDDLSVDSIDNKFFNKDENELRKIRNFVLQMLEYIDDLLEQAGE